VPDTARVRAGRRLSLERLDLSCPGERAAYERAFYAAFRRATGNRLVRQLWLWDDAAGRLATRVPYEEQIIYALRDADGTLVTAMAVNHALRTFQGAAYDFPAPPDPRGCCEFLTFFSLHEYRLPTRFRFWRDSFADLAAHGYHTGYATTASRVLAFYLRMGARRIEDRDVDGEMRHFLAFDLRRTDWRGGRPHGEHAV
jgi:hypothetical protein